MSTRISGRLLKFWAFANHNQREPDERLHIRISLSTSEPLEEHYHCSEALFMKSNGSEGKQRG
jgi:hypothetical protein